MTEMLFWAFSVCSEGIYNEQLLFVHKGMACQKEKTKNICKLVKKHRHFNQTVMKAS